MGPPSGCESLNVVADLESELLVTLAGQESVRKGLLIEILADKDEPVKVLKGGGFRRGR